MKTGARQGVPPKNDAGKKKGSKKKVGKGNSNCGM